MTPLDDILRMDRQKDAQIISLRVNLERAYDDLTRVYTERDEARKEREDLEYELATTHHMYGDPENLVERAEKAEARIAELEAIVNEETPTWLARKCDEAEARIAELEADVAEAWNQHNGQYHRARKAEAAIARLREALERIAALRPQPPPPGSLVKDSGEARIAREALAGGGREPDEDAWVYTEEEAPKNCPICGGSFGLHTPTGKPDGLDRL